MKQKFRFGKSQTDSLADKTFKVAEPVASAPSTTVEPSTPQSPAIAPVAFGLSVEEREWKQKVYAKLVKMLDLALISSQPEEKSRDQIRTACDSLIEQESMPLNAEARRRISDNILDEILGLGPLEPLLADDAVADILVNGCEKVYIERRGKLELTDISFDNDDHLLNIIDRIVSRVGRRIDESSPMVDARLADGSRVNAIIPPLAIDGPAMSIRRFSVDNLTGEKLVEFGAFSASMLHVMELMVKGRKNVLISGGTGSGKTTLLNVLSGHIPHDERIVTIEDSAELQLQQPHVVRLETRPPNIENKGEVTARDLVRNCLRMRPDRIVVGEVRGAEALDMLQAMNTGHDGSLTTVHANTPRDALSRIENMVAMSSVNLPPRALRSQIASAIDIVLQQARLEDGTRRLVSLQEINGIEGDVITMSEIFRFEREGLDENGRVVGRFRATGIVPVFREKLLQKGIHIDLALFDPKREL